MSNLNKIKMIKEMYASLKILNDLTHTAYRDELFDLCLKSERRHRKGSPYGVKNHLSASDAAKYFTVKYIVQALDSERLFGVEDYLYIRHECFYGQSIAMNHGELVKKALFNFDLNLFLKLVDYADLMKGEKS